MGKFRSLRDVWEPEFVPITMKIRDIVNICEDCHLKVSQRHCGAGRFFYPFSNQSDNGDLKKINFLSGD